MTQSAVSQHVKSLEQSLGVILFIRRARGVGLTDEGRKLLPQVGAALETLAAAAQSFEAGPTSNLLTIASSVSVAQWLIAPHLSEFTARHPDTRLRFLSTIWPDDFVTVHADVEIAFGSQKQVGRDAVLLEPSGLIALKSPTLLGDLQNLPLIESVGTSDGWKRWGEFVGGDLKPQIFVDSFGAALNFALSGNGVALVTELLGQHAISTGALIRAHPATVTAKEGYFLRINIKNPAAVLFKNWLLEKLSN